MPPSRRAAPMAPDERRRSILDVVVPMLLDGDDLSTRRIAEAAGIAEGTIFRVFPDKESLLMAAATEVVDPPGARADLDRALAGLGTLGEKVLVTTERLMARSEQVMRVMMALRRFWTAQPHDPHSHQGDPRQVLADAEETLHAMLCDVFEPHRAELRVDPGTAAVLLRTLVLGSRHPGAAHARRLSPEEITDALLHGVRETRGR